MIYGYLHQGSGAGNQLFRMVATRVKALDLGVDWRLIWNPDNSGKPQGFKCKDFMKFDEGKIIYEFPIGVTEWHEKKMVEDGVDIRPYDPEWNFIQDNTVIEGELQSEVYFQDYEKEIDEWLKVEPIVIPDDTCVIGFRGGEFALYPDLFLTKDYWDEGIAKMKDINPNMRFEIHTDDKPLAEEFFKDILPLAKVIHDIGINWRSCRYARYAIIANSSFFILPRWLRQGEGNALTISPHFWARRNTRVWSLPQNYYKSFLHI